MNLFRFLCNEAQSVSVAVIQMVLKNVLTIIYYVVILNNHYINIFTIILFSFGRKFQLNYKELQFYKKFAMKWQHFNEVDINKVNTFDVFFSFFFYLIF